jgi:hypothetical protein
MSTEKIKNCNGCSKSLSITTMIQSKDGVPGKFTLLPGSKHIAFGPNGNIYHLDEKCISAFADESVLLSVKEIPTESITSHSTAVLKKEYQKKCSVCLEQEDVWLFMMPCTHMICNGCYGKWKKMSNKCPVCNVPNYGLKTSFKRAKIYKPTLTIKTDPTPQPSHPPQLIPIRAVTYAGGPPLAPNSTLPSFFADQPPLLIQPLLIREVSSMGTQQTLSANIDFSHGSLSSFEALRAKALGATPENPNPSLEIAPISSIGSVISGTGNIFISATTQKTITFNDLVVTMYKKQEDNTFTSDGFFNFNNRDSGDLLRHSGDTVINSVGSGITKLQQGIWIKTPENHRVDIQFSDENIQGSDITSVFECQSLHEAFNIQKDKIIGSIDSRELPKYIILCAQATWQPHFTLKSLSPDMAPSCGVIMNQTVYACDWTDDTNMTCWANIFIYEN